MSTTTYAVTVLPANNDFGYGNKYHLDFNVSPNLLLIPGNTYKFDLSHESNLSHSLNFSTTENGTHNGGEQYSTGVSKVGVAGTQGSYLTIDVSEDTPDLYYYCSSHSGMGSSAKVSSNLLPDITPTPTPTPTLTPTATYVNIPDIDNDIIDCRGEPFIRQCLDGEIAVGNNFTLNNLVWTDTGIDLSAKDTIFVSVRGCICNESISLLSENGEPIDIEGNISIFTDSNDTCSSVQGINGTNNNKLFGTILPIGIDPSIFNQTDIDLSPGIVGANKIFVVPNNKSGRLWLLPYSNSGYQNNNTYVYCVNINVDRLLPTPTPTPTITTTPSVSLTPTNTPQPTSSVTPTISLTPTISNTPSITPTNSTTPTITPTNTSTPTSTITPTPTLEDCNTVYSNTSLYDSEMSIINSINSVVYVADGYHGVKIVDISNLQNPIIKKYLLKDQNIDKITISNNRNRLYVANKKIVSVYNINDPLNPIFITDIDLSSVLIQSEENISDIKVSEERDHCYIISREGMFVVLDLADNSILNNALPNVNINYYNYNKNSLSLYGSDYIYIAMRSATSLNLYKVTLSDITDSNITIATILGDNSSYNYIYPTSISSTDSYLYITDTSGDIIIVDNVYPFNINSTIQTLGSSVYSIVDWDNSNLFVANSNNGISLYDISNPLSPSLSNTIDFSDYPSKHIYLSDDGRLLSVSNGYGGIQLIKNCITVFRATPTVTPTQTPTPSLTPTITPTITTSPTTTPTISLTPSNTPTITTTPTVSPTVSLSPSITPTISITPSISPTISVTPSITSTITPTISVTPTFTPTISHTPTVTPTISITPTITNTPTITETPTNTPTISITPSITPTQTITPTPSITPVNRINRAMFNGSSLTSVGTNGGSSYYGTFDQSGLIYEWTDTTLSTNKVSRGGAYLSTNVIDLSIVTRRTYSSVQSYVGFRIASKFTTSNTSIAFAEVIDPDNIAHTTGFGNVAYNYKISKFLITNGDYIDFLNSIATTDTYGLFNLNMQSNSLGGILRFGSSGSYKYVCKPDQYNKPVNFVSWYSAARYCNWLHNGSPIGVQTSLTTEDGAYTLNGATSGIFERNDDVDYFLPSEDEWVKAAFFNGSAYNIYATQSDIAPTAVLVSPDGDGLF